MGQGGQGYRSKSGLSRVVVAGSINVDLVAQVERFPRPGETVPGRDLARFPGGKGANQAVAAARLGAPTTLVGAVGDDAFGAEMLAFLGTMGVDRQHVIAQPGRSTGTALITVAADENSIIVVPGANASVAPASIAAVDLRAGDILLCQLEIPIATVGAAIERAHQCGVLSILNAAPALTAARSEVAACDIIVMNEIELATYAGVPIDAASALPSIAHAAHQLRTRKSQLLIVTLGRRGALVSMADCWFHEPGRDVVVVDTTGAGDCFCGALAAALVRGSVIEAAVRFANAAASIAVQRRGAGSAMPLLAEVEAILSGP